MPPVSRRFMLRGAVLAAASLLVPVAARRADAGGRKGESGYEITDWIVIASSGQVTLGLSQPEVGQGSHTALPQILAEESSGARGRRVILRVGQAPCYHNSRKKYLSIHKELAELERLASAHSVRTPGTL
jgi:hypothetical protein